MTNHVAVSPLYIAGGIHVVKPTDLSCMEKDADLAHQYITTNTYPPGCSDNRKRTIRKKSKKFTIEKGELFYKECRKDQQGRKV